MKATILIDNLPGCCPVCEWGLAVYIEHNGHRILLDSGSTGAFTQNAEALGIDLSSVEYAVLSHAHYDHADGLPAFFELNSHAPLLLRKGTEENCCKAVEDGYKYIGIKKGLSEEYRNRIIYAEGDNEFLPGFWLIPHKLPGRAELGRKANMFVRTVGGYLPDAFDHEQSLVLETEAGLIIFSSCSHAGAMNILKEIKSTFPGKKIRAFIGGLHLYASSAETVAALADQLKADDLELLVTGHCTGDEAYAILKNKLGDRALQMSGGMVIEL